MLVQNFAAHGGVGFDDVIFHIGQAFRIVQNGIRDADFADIVEHGGILQIGYAIRIPAQRLRDFNGIPADAGGVAFCIGIFGVDGVGEGLDRLEGHLLNLFGPLFRHGGLPGHFLVQAVGIVNFQQGGSVVLNHRDGGENGKGEKSQRKAGHEGRSIVFREICPQWRVAYDKIQQRIVGGEQDAVFHADKIAHADGHQQGPENPCSFGIAGEGIDREDKNAEQGRDHYGDFTPLQDTRAERAADPGKQRDKRHQKPERFNRFVHKHIQQNQYQAQSRREKADKRQHGQIGFQPVADIQRTVQVFPDFTAMIHRVSSLSGCPVYKTPK